MRRVWLRNCHRADSRIIKASLETGLGIIPKSDASYDCDCGHLIPLELPVGISTASEYGDRKSNQVDRRKESPCPWRIRKLRRDRHLEQTTANGAAKRSGQGRHEQAAVGRIALPEYRQLRAPLRFCGNLRIRHGQARPT
jgi:hypothetical protein